MRLKPHRFSAQSGFDWCSNDSLFVARFQIKLHPQQNECLERRNVDDVSEFEFNLSRRVE